MKNQNTKNQSI